MDIAEPVVTLGIIGALLDLGFGMLKSGLSGGSTRGPGGWTPHIDPTGRTWKSYRQAGHASTPFKQATPQQQQLFTSGAWGSGGGGGPGSGAPGGTPGFVPPYLSSPSPSAAPPGGALPPAAPPPTLIGGGGTPMSITPGPSIKGYLISKAAGFVRSRLLGPRSSGGYAVGVQGDDFIASGGYPVSSTAYEDFREQTYTPDLWCRRLTRGVCVPAAPIKAGYSVPLVDWEGDLEGRVRATGGPIKKSAVIVYGGASDPDNQALLLGDILRGYKQTKYCEVVDEEGGGSAPVMGMVFEPPKRRRGGIHITNKALSQAKSTARKLKRLASTHKDLKRLLPR